MAISKKIRFEVFKRDAFSCAYCGKTPPSIILEVDHIDPKSKGGDDNINNLITACFDCNRGKRDIPLNKIPLQMIDNFKEIQEKELQIKEYQKFVKKINHRIQKDIDDIENLYSENCPEREFSPTFKNVSVKKFLSLLPKHEVADSLRLALSKKQCGEQALSYFCGICWNKIKGQEK